jgi:hypothetical protein
VKGRQRLLTLEGSGVLMASVIVVQRRDRLDCAMRRLLCTSGRRREDEEKLGYAICYYAVEVISNSRSVLFDAEDVTASGRNVNLLKNRIECKIEFNAFSIERGP